MNLPTDLHAIVGDAEPIQSTYRGLVMYQWWTDRANVDDCAYCNDGDCVQRVEWGPHWETFHVVHNHREREMD